MLSGSFWSAARFTSPLFLRERRPAASRPVDEAQDGSAPRSELILPNREIFVVGYGSLLSGYGLLAERRGGASRLVARDVHPVAIHNARRGLAKPSSHGNYLAMDIEPVDRHVPISASIAAGDAGIGGLLLTFDRECAPLIARREEYDRRCVRAVDWTCGSRGLAARLVPDGDCERHEFRSARLSRRAAHDARLHVAGIYFSSD